MTKKVVLRLVFAVIVLLLIFVSYSAFSIWSFSDKDQLVKTDVAVVLGAAIWDDEPSPVFRERINHSIWLYENDYVDKIIFTGGKGIGGISMQSQRLQGIMLLKTMLILMIF